MKFVLNYILKYKKLLVFALFLTAINQLFSLAGPQILRILTDEYATEASEYAQSEFVQGIILLLLVWVGTAFVSRVAKTFQHYFTGVIRERVGRGIYADAVKHAFSLPFQKFEDRRSGEILQKLQQARIDIQNFITQAVDTVFLSIVGITAVTIYAFIVHWSIGLLFILIVPVLGTITYVASRKIKQAQSNIVAELNTLSGSTTETLRNVELVKSLGLEDQEIDRLNRVNESILNLEVKKVKLVRTLIFIQGTMVSLMRTGLQFLLLMLVFHNTITLGEFFTFLFYSFAIFNPLYELGNVIASYREAHASAETLQSITLLEKESQPADPVNLGPIRELNFDNVSFHYETSESTSLKNVSFELKDGETVAFAGPSGSGKTTILKLLVGLYLPNDGDITINGISIRDIDRTEYRKRIGYVTQSAQLFSGTLAENLRFVKPDATDEECYEVLRKTNVGHIVDRSNEGLETKIGEGGIKLSGGERQRLSIARALLREPEVLIFDEATSSLDSITEESLTETIREIGGRNPSMITILIAHRLSTIAHAERIYVFERGEIIETGTHNELLQYSDGLYRAMWRSQQGKE